MHQKSENVKTVKLAFILGGLYMDIRTTIYTKVLSFSDSLEFFYSIADKLAESINRTIEFAGDVWVLGHVTEEEVKRALEIVAEGMGLNLSGERRKG